MRCRRHGFGARLAIRFAVLLVLLSGVLPEVLPGAAPALADEREAAPGGAAATESGRLRATLRPDGFKVIPIGRFHSWRLRLTDRQGEPVSGAQITVGGGMDDHGHGLPTAPKVIEGRRAGEYRIEGVKFTMAGEWTLVLSIQVGGARDRVSFRLDVDY